MKVIVFDQWDKLVSLIRQTASGAASERTQYALNRLQPSGGRVKLADRSMNILSLGDENVTVEMPDIVPGRARDFLLRVTAAGAGEIAFTGAEAFEGEEGTLQPPGDGETAVYFFTETAADTLLVARKIAKPLAI